MFIWLSLYFFAAATHGQSLIDPKKAEDCGCGGTFNLPHYAEATGHGVPAVPDEGFTGRIVFSHVASLDDPLDHDWHDFNYYILFDEPYLKYNSSANYKLNASYTETLGLPTTLKGKSLMEIEWDSAHIPERFWASAGDAVWIKGRYIWDCGHPKDDQGNTG